MNLYANNWFNFLLSVVCSGLTAIIKMSTTWMTSSMVHGIKLCLFVLESTVCVQSIFTSRDEKQKVTQIWNRTLKKDQDDELFVCTNLRTVLPACIILYFDMFRFKLPLDLSALISGFTPPTTPGSRPTSRPTSRPNSRHRRSYKNPPGWVDVSTIIATERELGHYGFLQIDQRPHTDGTTKLWHKNLTNVTRVTFCTNKCLYLSF